MMINDEIHTEMITRVSGEVSTIVPVGSPRENHWTTEIITGSGKYSGDYY